MKARVPVAGALLVALAAQAQDLRFEQVFLQDDGAAPLHYRARYVAGGSEHEVEAWIAGGMRLKRVTDGALEVHAQRTRGEDEYRLTVLDLQRRIATRIDRASLYRVGHFAEWFELAQVLRHPRGAYTLARTTAPADPGSSAGACDWYTLAQAGQASRICWSAAHRLPLLIVSEQGQVQWRITHVDREPVAPQQFAVHDEGFVRNVASDDIETD